MKVGFRSRAGFAWRAVWAGAVAILCLVGLVQAQGYPQRPVRMIVPFAAGGTTDSLGRVVAHFLGERLGQQVVV